MKLIVLGLLLITVLFELSGDYFLKKWTVSNEWKTFALGVLVYGVGTIAFAFALKYEDLSKAIVIFTMLSIICVVAMGVFVFHEELSTINKIGIGLALVSLLLVEA